MKREYEVTIEQTIVSQFVHDVKAANSEEASQKALAAILELHPDDESAYKVVHVEECLQAGERVFYIEDEHTGFWVEILGGPHEYNGDEEEGSVNDYLVRDEHFQKRESAEGKYRTMEFLTPITSLTKTPFQTGYLKLGYGPDYDNLMFFRNSTEATDHMEKYFEDMPGDYLAGIQFQELTSLLEGKRNSALVDGILYWIQPFKYEG